MRKRQPDIVMNLVPMIDVIFQIFIFFVCTVDLQSQSIDIGINMAMAPHGKALSATDPRTIHVDIDSKGKIFIANTWLSVATLQQILTKARGEYGPDVPIVIRGDLEAMHATVKQVMDACSRAGISQIMFAAIKEKK